MSLRFLLLFVLGIFLNDASFANKPSSENKEKSDIEIMPVPSQIRTRNVPSIPLDLYKESEKYKSTAGQFVGWHPQKRSIVISMYAGNINHLHLVETPGEKCMQLTSGSKNVKYGAFLKNSNKDSLLISIDNNGNEAFQYYLQEGDSNEPTLITDGESRNRNLHFCPQGDKLVYLSNRRHPNVSDIYICDLNSPSETKEIHRIDSPYYTLSSWSPDGKSLLLRHAESQTQASLYIYDLEKNSLTKIPTEKEIRYDKATFHKNGKTIITLCDEDSDFTYLARIDVDTGSKQTLIPSEKWNITTYAISADDKTLAYIKNEDGYDKLHLWDMETEEHLPAPELPGDIIKNMEWHSTLNELAFSLGRYDSPSDTYSLNPATNTLTKWTETPPQKDVYYSKPETVHIKSFDDLTISALVYYPDRNKFKGPRPAIVIFHGGPVGQSRPIFLNRNNYYIDQLGITLIYPNIRGSSGYGKTFKSLDDGLLRGDSIKDGGAVLEWAASNPAIDPARIGVMGGSYGGFMTLSTMIEYRDIIKCGVESVGISNIATFLKNTSSFRREQRRLEYGDETNPEMLKFMEETAPTNNAKKIKAPLFIIQGENDIRVPASEAVAMFDAIRFHGGTAWYLTALDEGHSFLKMENIDFRFAATIAFFKKYLLEE